MPPPPPTSRVAPTSRVVLKNVPPHFLSSNAARLRKHLLKGLPDLQITDLYVPAAAPPAGAPAGAPAGNPAGRRPKKPDAKPRRLLAFVGFATPEQAASVVRHFHGSFFDTVKVSAELARAKKEGGGRERGEWSKWTKGTTAYERRTGEKGEAAEAGEGEGKGAAPAASAAAAKAARKKEEFVDAMTSRGQGKMWSNDDGKVAAAAAPVTVVGHDSDSESDGEVAEPTAADDEDSEEEADPLKNAREANKAMSDMDFFRSKVVQKDDLEADGEADAGGAGDGDDSSSVASDSDGGGEDEGSLSSPAPPPPPQPDAAESSTRLFIRNLPFAATEDELAAHLSTVAAPALTHAPLDDRSNRKGFAFATFKSAAEADMVLEQLDGGVFQGRLVHLMRAKEHATGWNASFVRSDTVVSSLADKLNVSKGDILDHNEGGMAVRLALGETKLIEENREYFKKHNVDVDLASLASAGAASKKRSGTTILVKNLPYETQPEDLTKIFSPFGTVSRLLLPPSRAVAIVEFAQPGEARRAFKKLAYTKFKHVPLYLEWAPEGVIGATTTTTTMEVDETPPAPPAPAAEEEADEDEEDQGNVVAHSIFVKNLKFTTTEDSLSHFFEAIAPGKVTATKIPTKIAPEGSKAAGAVQSMGFGFVEFSDAAAVKTAIKRGNGQTLDGHMIEVKRSDKAVAKGGKPGGAGKKGGKAGGKPGQTKLMVRNLPFEATRTELMQLFGNFGTLKKTTIPKKMDGTSRGFGFVEFLTSEEAAAAKESLAQTHLYGRHLIIEWSEDKEDLGTLREKAKRDVGNTGNADMARKKKQKKGGDHTVFD
ncbi:hypothetical protein TeGR_g3521 [Tetraparma gracilis]|uniref:RRM domain-containing protein n=1 Tax=Tetraparma gracilis TaxID=2962635 RepID=A0ABQ6MDB2_9STRA|nr:hypothetical protein TeGR_g3521 [Tetraparma gracilis]